jgi:transketolase
MCAAQYRLDNLVLIVDRNRIQQGDFTESTINMNPLGEKWRAFGWHVIEVNGHSHRDLLHALGSGPMIAGKPTCILANTIKGHGVSFMENNPAWHHGVPNDQQLAQALDELAKEEL